MSDKKIKMSDVLNYFCTKDLVEKSLESLNNNEESEERPPLDPNVTKMLAPELARKWALPWL